MPAQLSRQDAKGILGSTGSSCAGHVSCLGPTVSFEVPYEKRPQHKREEYKLSVFAVLAQLATHNV